MGLTFPLIMSVSFAKRTWTMRRRELCCSDLEWCVYSFDSESLMNRFQGTLPVSHFLGGRGLRLCRRRTRAVYRVGLRG